MLLYSSSLLRVCFTVTFSSRQAAQAEWTAADVSEAVIFDRSLLYLGLNPFSVEHCRICISLLVELVLRYGLFGFGMMYSFKWTLHYRKAFFFFEYVAGKDIQKPNWVWLRMPVVSDTQEVEGDRITWAQEIWSSLVNVMRLLFLEAQH